MILQFWKPSIGRNEIDFTVFNGGYLGHGSYTDKFEAECAKKLSIDRSNLIACSTGHAALHNSKMHYALKVLLLERPL